MKIQPILLVAAIFAIVSCSTPYQEVGDSAAGGHMFKRKAKDVFAVGFVGNGFTNPKKAKDFAMLRAAEVTLEHQFRYFTILGKEDMSSTDYVDTGGSSYTTGTVSNYGGYGSYSGHTTYTPSVTPVYKPGSAILIKCFTRQPSGHVGKIYDAAQVKSELRTKHKL